jgi:hypothetical protein
VWIQISRDDAGFILDILDVRAEQYEITADYCLQHGENDAEDLEELREYVASLEHGYNHEDSICEVRDGREAMNIAKSIREMEARIRAALK